MNLHCFALTVTWHRMYMAVYLTVTWFFNGCWCGLDEDRLVKYLFEDQKYRPVTRPVLNNSDAVEIKFTGSILQILDIDEKTETLRISLWLRFKWNDPRLVWNVSDYEGVYSLTLPCEMVWLPDIYLHNTALDDVDKRMMTKVIVENNGDIMWVPPGIFRSSCRIKIAWFPFDTQTCELKFGSWSYGSQFLNLTTFGEDRLYSHTENGEWDLLESSIKRYEFLYDGFTYPDVSVIFKIVIRRRASYYVLNLLVPCAFITILSLFNFIQPPESGEKIGLGITILLSLSVFQLIIAEMLPATSSTIPVIVAHFCAVMALCTLSLIMTILSLKFHHTRPNLHRMPRWVRIGICDWLAWCLHMNRPGKPVSKRYVFTRSNDDRLKFRRPKQDAALAENVEITSVSLVNDYNRSDNSKDLEQMNMTSLDKLDPLSSIEDITDKSAELQALENLNRSVRAVLKELKIMTTKIEEDKIVEDEINEWQYAAIVIDRLCFWVCLILFSVGFIAILTIGYIKYY